MPRMRILLFVWWRLARADHAPEAGFLVKPGGQPLRLPARMPQRRESGGNTIGVESIGNVADCGHGHRHRHRHRHRFRYIDRMAAGVVLKIQDVFILSFIYIPNTNWIPLFEQDTFHFGMKHLHVAGRWSGKCTPLGWGLHCRQCAHLPQVSRDAHFGVVRATGGMGAAPLHPWSIRLYLISLTEAFLT